ncbi:hypothetical protein OUZ56_018870 [Daphnia magna]|uniref:DUF4806 domain-containing protein n=1 Tax=Daphnia magna TaxID=35525 RepID=A0ABQ9Z9Z1_9CRUS|nr:hypothetical protein OUZ56_018870 [Daphnia magna]
MILLLLRIGGINLQKTVYAIMEKLFSYEIGTKFTWTGKSSKGIEKAKFSDLKNIYAGTSGAVLGNKDLAGDEKTTVKVQYQVTEWLRHCQQNLKSQMNLNDLVKAKEKCAAILNEAKLEKRSVEFVNAVSANANAQELRETKNEISELKVIEQLSQKMRAAQLTDKSHESINAVATGHNAQLAESKQEIEELKNLLKANNSTRVPHQPPVHRNPPPFYKDNHNNLVMDPLTEESVIVLIAQITAGAQQLTTLTGVGGDQMGQPASNAIKVGTLRVIAHPHHFIPTPDMRRQLRILVSSTPGIRKTRSHQL